MLKVRFVHKGYYFVDIGDKKFTLIHHSKKSSCSNRWRVYPFLSDIAVCEFSTKSQCIDYMKRYNKRLASKGF